MSNEDQLDENGLYISPIILGDPARLTPLIICFHGSGDSCASWVPLAKSLRSSHRVLLYDRGETNPKPNVAVREMLEYLEQAQLSPPYVLIAHSYGGIFAREFLQQRPLEVAGMVLVETGQETAMDPKVEKQQYKSQILGNKPLSVIRGNTLIGKWAQFQTATMAAKSDAERGTLAAQKQLLDAMDMEDEILKKVQLQLSRTHHYVHIPDCGHNVIQQRPEVVAAEVQWVMDNLSPPKRTANLHERISDFLRRVRLRG